MKGVKISKVEMVGFAATWLILLGYFLIKIDMIDAAGLIYQGINLIGSVGIVWVSLKRKARQPALLNIVWAVIAVVAIGRLFL